MTALVDVVEYTDPGCIWSWSAEPALRALRQRYGAALRWRRVFGIQLDAVAPDADPGEFLQEWHDVARHTGAPVTGRLERIHTSTIPASRAARAAELQGPAVAELALRRLREAVFVDGRPADTRERIEAALDAVPGLDLARLLADAESDAVIASVDADRAEARRPHPAVLDLDARHPALGELDLSRPNPGAARPTPEGGQRYGFPTLVLRGPAGERVAPGWRQLSEYSAAVVAVAPELRSVRLTALDPDEAIVRHRSLTLRELELLTTGDEPRRALRVDTATGSLWLHPAEARRRDLRAVGAAR